jgi:hypothetical protein
VVNSPVVGADLASSSATQDLVHYGSMLKDDPLSIVQDLDSSISRLRKSLLQQTDTANKNEQNASELRDQVIKLNTLVEEQLATIRDVEEKKAREVAEATQREAAQKEMIEELQKQVGGLTKKLEGSPKLVIDNRSFDQFPSGNVNAGLYVTKQPQVVTIGDTEYTETAVLSEFKGLDVSAVLADTVVLNGIPFRRISGGHNDGKLVQELGPHSVLEHEGKYFVRWFIRKEKPLEI